MSTMLNEYRDLHYGKFDSPMAHYLDVHLSDFTPDDEWNHEVLTEGAQRFGRRIFYWDDQGFVGLDTYPTVADAERHWQDWQAKLEREQDAVCTEQGCTGTVCRHCGETIHQVKEEHATYYQAEDGDSLSYVPTLHDHEPILDDDTSTHVWGCAREWIG